MARSLYIAYIAVPGSTAGTLDSEKAPVPVSRTAGGTPETDLLAAIGTGPYTEGSPITQPDPDDTTGRTVWFGPDGYQGALWVQGGAGEWVEVPPTGIADRVGAVSTVSVGDGAPQPPDASGNVALDVPTNDALTAALDEVDTAKVDTDPAADTGLSRTLGSAGPLVEVVENGVARIGLDRLGGLVVNGTRQKLAMVWTPDDDDPTVGGTLALPDGVYPVAVLADLSEQPAWLNGIPGLVITDTTLVAPPAAPVTGQFFGNGYPTGHILAAGDGGFSGDTTVTTISGGGTATVRTDDGIVDRVIEFVTAANLANLIFDDDTAVPPSDSRTVSFLFKTPTTWPASAAPIVAGQNAGTPCWRVVLAGSSSPGQMRIVDANLSTAWSSTATLALNTWYHGEVNVLQSSTAASGTIRLRMWPLGHAVDADPLINPTSAWQPGRELGATHDQIVLGMIGPNTVTYRAAKVQWNEDETSYIGEPA